MRLDLRAWRFAIVCPEVGTDVIGDRYWPAVVRKKPHPWGVPSSVGNKDLSSMQPCLQANAIRRVIRRSTDAVVQRKTHQAIVMTASKANSAKKYRASTIQFTFVRVIPTTAQRRPAHVLGPASRGWKTRTSNPKEIFFVDLRSSTSTTHVDRILSSARRLPQSGRCGPHSVLGCIAVVKAALDRCPDVCAEGSSASLTSRFCL